MVAGSPMSTGSTNRCTLLVPDTSRVYICFWQIDHHSPNTISVVAVVKTDIRGGTKNLI